MKNIYYLNITLFFILMFISPASSQGNYFNHKSGYISFRYPGNRPVREHLFLLLTPKSVNLRIRFEISGTDDLNGAVKESLTDLKSLYPDDNLFILKDYVINKLKVKEIDAIIQSKKLNYFLLKTPADRVVKVSYIAVIGTALKYKSEIQKIMKSIKPIE